LSKQLRALRFAPAEGVFAGRDARGGRPGARLRLTGFTRRSGRRARRPQTVKIPAATGR